ncbi:hypothetical protein GCM10009682_36580 [Luedemannella flava]|uniref:DUF4236 domain-containing protein n=1 Tax=Luedemannella flava TaxID=349316 RepID=A0ABP4YHD6_9ACTN
MGLGFSFRVAPGVRVRASSRGIGASFGPRAARVHVGPRGAAFSTGVGPVSYYAPLTGGRRGGSSVAAQQRQVAAAQRAYAVQQKEAEARQLAAVFQALFDLHRQPFPAAVAPVAPEPAPPDRAAILDRHLAERLRGIRPWQFAARSAAHVQAAAAADREVAAGIAHLTAERARWQESLNRWWADLLRNDPPTVLEALERVFADNEAPAAAVGVDGDEVSLVVLAPGAGLVPERYPDTTPTGRLTLRKLSATDRASLHQGLVFGHVLVTVKEAFATAPALRSARVAVVRTSEARSTECLMAGRFARADLDRVDWQTADAHAIVRDAATEVLVNPRGRTRELAPLDLGTHPELAALVAAVDLAADP